MPDLQFSRRSFLQPSVILYTLLSCVGFLSPASVYGKVWEYSTAETSIAIDPVKTGQVIQWQVGGKPVIELKEAAAESPLELESETGALAHFRPESYSEEKGDGTTKLQIKGKMTAPYLLDTTLEYEIAKAGAQIKVRIRTAPPTGNAPKIKRWSWRQPLSLHPRKRIYFRGAHELDWESRYFYQYVANGSGGLLPHADRNEWQWFSLDQLTPTAFRLWKSESDLTAPLVMQEGEALPPYLQVYDPQGGLTLEYPQLATFAPKSLRIHATGGATAEVSLWPLSSPPAPINTSGLFGVTHEIILTASPSESAIHTVRTERNLHYPNLPRPEAQESLREAAWLRETENAPTAVPLPVTGGYPFRQGELTDPRLISVAVGGEKVPVQTKVLGYWPDRSIKWLLLTFMVNPSNATKAETPAPRITFRQGGSLPVSVMILKTPEPQPKLKQQGLAVQSSANQVSIGNGDLTTIFSTGTEWLSIKHLETSLLATHSKARLAYSDYLLQPQQVFPFAHAAQGGQTDKGTLSVQSVVLEESGPLRAVVRMEGMTNNQEPTRIILRAEIVAGRPEIRLSHSSEFLFKDPRKTFLSGLGLSLPLATLHEGKASEDRRLVQASYFAQRQEPAPVDASQFNAGWLEADCGAVRLVAAIRNFRETAPKAIGFKAENKEIRLELWPADAPVMDVRRYSNFPHLGQGEGVTINEDWVEQDYYPNDPFVGISRTHEIVLGFWPKDRPMPSAQVAAADFQSPPLLYAGWQRYADCHVAIPGPDQDKWPAAWSAWSSFAHFWLYHRNLHSWYGFWDFGDLRHHFQSGAGWILPADTLADALKTQGDPNLISQKLIWDASPANDWAYDNGRWGWGNTEGLPNLFLSHEYLRNGNRTVYFASEALARFSRDVVIRHDGKWFGTGTRHGVQHWSDGNHEERQTTAMEYRIPYFLTGDGRSSDVIRKLYQGYYNRRRIDGQAAHGGRLAGLNFHAELSGDPIHFQQLQQYAHTFVEQGRLSLTPAVEFPQVVVRGRGEMGDQMFFHYYGGWHTLLEYQQATNDPILKEAILKTADETLANEEMVASYRTTALQNPVNYTAVAFAAWHAEDPTPYAEFLTSTLRGNGWQMLYQTVTKNPAHWSGPTGMLRGYIPGCFFSANWAPYITGALKTDHVWSPEIARQVNIYEEEGQPSAPPARDWQLEYDENPDLAPFLDYQKPWLQPASP